MTTVAIRKYNDRIELASDSLADDSGVGHHRKKLYSQHVINFVFGHTGVSDQGQLLHYCISDIPTTSGKSGDRRVLFDRYEEGFHNYFHEIKDKFQTDGNDTEAFLVIFNYKIYDLRLNKSSVDFREIQGSFYSIGSGRKFALAAMECGKSPREAVEIAIKYDIYSGGEIQEEIVEFGKKRDL